MSSRLVAGLGPAQFPDGMAGKQMVGVGLLLPLRSAHDQKGLDGRKRRATPGAIVPDPGNSHPCGKGRDTRAAASVGDPRCAESKGAAVSQRTGPDAFALVFALFFSLFGGSSLEASSSAAGLAPPLSAKPTSWQGALVPLRAPTPIVEQGLALDHRIWAAPEKSKFPLAGPAAIWASGHSHFHSPT